MRPDPKDPASRAAWVYGQPMRPCPKCGSYNMKPQMPIRIDLTGEESMPVWARWVQRQRVPEEDGAMLRRESNWQFSSAWPGNWHDTLSGHWYPWKLWCRGG